MSEHLKAHVPGTSYFCTLTVVGWADVFKRRRCAEVIQESLAHCQANKTLQVIATAGSLVMTRTPGFEATRMQLDVSSLAQRVYTVRLSGPAGVSTARLVR